ncbi:S16 family serine protease [Alkalihalobacterium sp. APHAB7]|uniref:S16 family serine protease n=1 Tax=Alkalihalobacterium sp. APHAB7 TaxID=3402081 RepID=UPI003AAC497C
MNKLVNFSKKIDLLMVLFVVSIMVLLSIAYFSIPTNAIISIPGTVTSMTEDIEMDQAANVHRVSVRNFIVYDRLDFLEYMWNNKELVSTFGYSSFDTNKDATVAALSREIEALELKIEKYDVIFNFIMNRYSSEEEVDIVLNDLKFPDDAIGSSDSLAITLSLIGNYEQKPWMASEQKVVITGSLGEGGAVVPVGGVYLKALASKKDQADVFIIPQANIEEANRYMKRNSKPLIVAVETINEAIDWLDENIK